MAEEKDDAPPKKKGKLLLVIIAAVLILALGGGAAYYFLVVQPAAAAKADEDADEEDSSSKKGKAKEGEDAGQAASDEDGKEKEHEPKKKKKKKKKNKNKDEPPAFINMDPFTVNLADTEQERFLQISMVIEVAGDAAAEEIKKHMPLVRDTILKLLSSSKSVDLRSAEGKQKLADLIISSIEKVASHDDIEIPDIDKVFFTAFIIQ